ncbi:hypothetical protein WJX81_008393 [Elliptochloris bilobata]|uniref:Uncharacterized protein n=1 Tax=Elliptochloris bilobata TaxID=381761 RepID=A0AAW1RN25_9CHLO
MLWGAIAAVSLNASCLGNISKKSFERSLGTLLGGWLGYGVALARIVKLRSPWGYLASSLFASLALGALGGRAVTRAGLALAGAWLGFAAAMSCQLEFWFIAWAAVMTYLAYFLGDLSRLGGAGRLGMIAFFVVHWGVLDARNALFIAASRIACIQISVVQLALLSVLICPEVASERVVGSVRAAMKAAEAFTAATLRAEAGDDDICSIALRDAKPITKGQEIPSPFSQGGTGSPQQVLAGAPAVQSVAGRLREADAAKAAAAFRTALEKGASNGALAVSEWFLGSWRGRHWYLPTLTWHNERKQRMGTFHLPERELRAFAAAARRAFGSLEGLHAALASVEGLEGMRPLAPAKLWEQLREASAAFFQELAEHCPAEGVSARALVPARRLAALQAASRALLYVDQMRMLHPEAQPALRGADAPAGDDAACRVACTPAQTAEAPGALEAAVYVAGAPTEAVGSTSTLVRRLVAGGADAPLLHPAGAEAYAAAVQRAAAHFHLAQLAACAGELHSAVNALLPRLPGAAIAPTV